MSGRREGLENKENEERGGDGKGDAERGIKEKADGWGERDTEKR